MASLGLEKEDDDFVVPGSPPGKPKAASDLSSKKEKQPKGGKAQGEPAKGTSAPSASSASTRRALNWQLAQFEKCKDKKCKDCKKFKPLECYKLLQRMLQRSSKLLQSL